MSWDDYWKTILARRSPDREADLAGLTDLAQLYHRSFSTTPCLSADERKRMKHLASHLRQKITLNPGPPDSGNEEDKKWESKARWALQAIALNPDGHHWTYITCVIREAVEEILAKRSEEPEHISDRCREGCPACEAGL